MSAAKITRFDIGSVRVDRVVESEKPILDPLAIFPQATHADIAREISWLAPRFYDPVTRLLIIPIQGFVIRLRGKIIIVDTCVGDCKSRARPMFNDQRYDWLGALAAVGVKPEAVDYVVLTHFHVDHVGWNTRLENGQWVPTFPNARYLFTHQEWEYWSSADGRAAMERTDDYLADSVEPVIAAGLADFVPMDHELFPEVRLIPAPGHTPGFVCVGVASAGKRLVLASDVLHSPLQCRFPEWPMSYCAEPERASRTRTGLLSSWARSGTLVMPTHFPSPSAGYVERAQGAFTFRYVWE